MTEALGAMSDDALIEALKKLAGPVIRELARRGYDVRLDAPAVSAADGLDLASAFAIQRPA